MEPTIHLNLWAILAAALANFAVGFIWYTLIFAKPWREEMHVDDSREITATRMITSLGLNFIGCLLMAFVFTHNIQAWDPHTWGQNADFVPKPQAAVMSAMFTWVGFYLPQDFNKISFQGRSWRLFFIDTSNNLVGLLAAAFILVYFS